MFDDLQPIIKSLSRDKNISRPRLKSQWTTNTTEAVGAVNVADEWIDLWPSDLIIWTLIGMGVKHLALEERVERRMRGKEEIKRRKRESKPVTLLPSFPLCASWSHHWVWHGKSIVWQFCVTLLCDTLIKAGYGASLKLSAVLCYGIWNIAYGNTITDKGSSSKTKGGGVKWINQADG